MNFDWNNLPPEARAKIEEIQQQLRDRENDTLLRREEREMAELEAGQDTIDELASTDKLNPGNVFPTHQGHVTDVVADYNHPANHFRATDDLNARRSAAEATPVALTEEMPARAADPSLDYLNRILDQQEQELSGLSDRMDDAMRRIAIENNMISPDASPKAFLDMMEKGITEDMRREQREREAQQALQRQDRERDMYDD